MTMITVTRLVPANSLRAIAFFIISNFSLAAVPPGSVTFAQPQPYAVGRYPTSVAVGDFNSDGKPDIAVASLNDNKINILLGNGDGTFRTASSIDVANRPIYVLVANFKKDRKADLVVLCENDPNVYVLLGNGNGTFRAPAGYKLGGDWPKQAAVGDFNGDGIPDLAVASGQSPNYSIPGKLTVFIGAGDGSFRNPVVTTVETNPYSLAVGDFNGDGKADVAITTLQNAHPNQIDILISNGNGTFQSPRAVQTADVAITSPSGNPANPGRLTVLLNMTK
jgi:hypothetical protein